MPLSAGTRLGVYEIVAPLGAGGMGEVYRARDTKLDRDVALKFLPPAFASDADRIARFEREAKVLASLNHPHIAALYGTDESGGQHFLVMELVEGETLDARVKPRGPSDSLAPATGARGFSRAIPIDEALAIARQIAEALEAAHEKGIVHRDLKPANIKITPNDTVKVLDFGLAKAMGSSEISHDSGAAGLTHSPTLTFAGATQAGMILGTAPYMSPEQAKGRPADKRSDVWAFGCVLYEMLTGRRAFEGDDVSDVLASVIKGDPEWTALPSNVPHAVNALVRGCLKKDRKERIGDLSTALFLLNQRDAAAPAASVPVAAAWSGWRSWLLVATGIAVGGAAVAALSWRQQASGPPAVTRFAIALPPGQQLTRVRQAVAISPNGRQIVYAADGLLYLRSLSEIEPRAIPGPEAAIGPVFSPDGQSVAFWNSVESAIKRVPISGGTPITICSASPTPSGISWGDEGILFALAGTGIMRIPENGGKPEVVVRVDASEALAHGPQQLPGGFLLFTLARQSGTGRGFPWDQAQIVVQSLKTGERKTIIEGSDGRYLETGHLLYAISGIVFAVPFDVKKLAVTGSAVPIIEGISRATSVSGGAAQLALSKSGAMVYLPGPASAGREDVILFDRKGATEGLNLPSGAYAFPRVSPDGKRLALETRDGKEANVSIYELSGTSSVRRLTFGGNNRFPIWSGDGRHVAFQSDRDGDRALFWQPPDGGTAERLTKPEPRASHVAESWSPDGDTILYSEAKGSEISLWAFSIRDRKSARFGDVKSFAMPPDAVFSPDGRWVAYQVGEPNQGEATTFVEPFPPTGTKYQIARGGRAAWSRDGKNLFYVPAPGQFMAVTVTTQPTFTFSNPMAVPRGFGVADPVSPRPYDVMPDGRLLGVGADFRSGPAGPGQLQVVLNWLEELKARAPAAK